MDRVGGLAGPVEMVAYGDGLVVPRYGPTTSSLPTATAATGRLRWAQLVKII